MSKPELIERVMRLNRSARREFLEEFTANELSDYLHQLESAPNPLHEEIAPIDALPTVLAV